MNRKPMLKLPLWSRPGHLLCALLMAQMLLWNWPCFADLFCSQMTSLSNFWVPTAATLAREKSEIEWSVCPDDIGFSCSFLRVPLDYGTTGDYATLAMRMYPATVPPSQRLGTIFTNPGGPGTSGHAILLKTGPSLSAIFHGKFDIISWDPRGINMSTPRISCHPTELHRQLFSLSHNSGDLDFYNLPVSTANITLFTAAARAELLTQLCRDAVSDKVLRSVTTVNVARDLEQMRRAIGEGDLIYWGFSYGTTLGATYAAMFPENVGRMVLDGVVYAPEQYSSLLDHGLSSGDSTSEVFDGFVSSCIRAGPARCALVKDRHMDASDLKQHILNLLNRLRTSPLPVVHPKSQAMPSILRPMDLLLPIFAALLRPTNWANLASAIGDLEHGDGTTIAAFSGAGGGALDLRNRTDGERAEDAGWETGREMGTVENEADMAVFCGDAPPFSDLGDDGWAQDWLDWREKLVLNDAIGGTMWFKKMIRCKHWGRIRPSPERYNGQWRMGHDLKAPKHPLLFVSNTYDPVSPVSSGRRMVEVFGSNHSRLIENNAYGHCSVSQPSLCIASAIHEYMIDGTLPGEHTICQPEAGTIFPPIDVDTQLQYKRNDESVVQALHKLSQTLIWSGGW
ncbi:Alpha/Beta hydrolase protein [Mycena alexandri]|uniref:Alpha/Beta hydrolase protein n=1 Tax=Mycena alexandri TaxID=1745969 RepID=A0AAD6SNA2_9AGAR|nr:Alpha/Beta hydrolase protein [Mycena alexandri]